MPDYTQGHNDNFTDVARLSGNAPSDMFTTTELNLSATQTLGGSTLVWKADERVLNDGSGLSVGAILTVTAAGVTEYEITGITDIGAWTESDGDQNGSVVTARVTVDKVLTTADKNVVDTNKNSGVLMMRKFQGTHKSLADHLRLRRQGII
tara:strand:+ start:1065 stop:1517 length:453 start_codon:yes stop_codon:yes gene_type:complete